MSYKKTLRLEELKIANDEFDFERCESEYLSLKKNDTSEEDEHENQKKRKKNVNWIEIRRWLRNQNID